uniref:NADH-ubiquinone oxidoreductase chain 6 n=1 Tax=Euphaea yayeyamana TaxID=543830 RepID=A0A0A7A8N4_9ODON|nr:NADH dehydrogenase subunit 6 [Euphaea yayeyamana]AHC02118.1 NADH dehydrogenase subunit 6 [Euphaea yayeyamana]
MSQLIFTATGVINSTLFMKMKHPMSMGIILLVQTIYICIITSSMAQNAWFSYILFLVFLGGMLVLFIYMNSVASNELFQTSKNFMWVMMPVLFMLPLMMIDPMTLFNNSDEMYTMDNQSEFWQTSSMFNYPNNIMTILAVMYLFLTLIVVVKITESHQGPLRSSN